MIDLISCVYPDNNILKDKSISYLKVVAWVFILYGIIGVMNTYVSWIFDSLRIDYWILGLFIGKGLLRRSRRWRICALFFLGFSALAGVVYLVTGFYNVVNWEFKLFGFIIYQKMSILISYFIIVLLLLLSLWQYLILRRKAIKVLFS